MNLLVSISKNIYPLDEKKMKEASQKWASLIHPPKSMGRLEDISIKLAGIYGNSVIEDSPKKCLLAFAADHGVYEEGVSPHPQELSRMQFENFVNGKCGVGALANFNKVDIMAVDVGLKGKEPIKGVYDYKIREGTDNISKGPAMTIAEAVKSLEIGIEVAEKCIVDGYKIIGVGEMGISNTTPSTAILSVMSGINPLEITDMGAGLNKNLILNKAKVIKRAIEVNNPNPTDGIEVLSKVGGFEIGAMAGVMLGCAANNIPVVLDGYISYAAALIASKINPRTKNYLICSHLSDEIGSIEAINLLGIKPIIDLDMRLGEGSGAVLIMNIIDSSIYAYNHMAKFDDEPIGELLRKWGN